MAEESYESEWNEQILFANLYFSLSFQCRRYQSAFSTFMWWSTLDSKYTHAATVLSSKELLSLEKKREIIVKKIGTISKTNKENPLSERRGKNEQELYELMRKFEIELDRAVDKHMPVLRRKDPEDTMDIFG